MTGSIEGDRALFRALYASTSGDSRCLVCGSIIVAIQPIEAGIREECRLGHALRLEYIDGWKTCLGASGPKLPLAPPGSLP